MLHGRVPARGVSRIGRGCYRWAASVRPSGRLDGPLSLCLRLSIRLEDTYIYTHTPSVRPRPIVMLLFSDARTKAVRASEWVMRVSWFSCVCRRLVPVYERQPRRQQAPKQWPSLMRVCCRAAENLRALSFFAEFSNRHRVALYSSQTHRIIMWERLKGKCRVEACFGEKCTSCWEMCAFFASQIVALLATWQNFRGELPDHKKCLQTGIKCFDFCTIEQFYRFFA